MAQLFEMAGGHPWVALGVGVVVLVITLVVIEAARDIIKGRAFEQSRREIAAYIAEGSMKPAEGAALLSAGPRSKDNEGDEAGKTLASLVNWSSISEADGQKIIAERAALDERAWKQLVELVEEGMPVAGAIGLVRARASEKAGRGSAVPA